MQNLIAAVQDFYIEWMKRPPLFSMLIARTSPADDDQLAQVIEADARHLTDRGIAPRLSRYHQYLYDVHPNQKSRAEAVHAHAMGLVEFKGMSREDSEKTAMEELHRLDRDGIARLVRIAAEKKTTREDAHQEADEPIHFTGIIHGPGGSKKSLASLRAAEESRVTIRREAKPMKRAAFWQTPPVIMTMLVLVLGLGSVLGWYFTTQAQEQREASRESFRESLRLGFMERSKAVLDGSTYHQPAEVKLAYEHQVHMAQFPESTMTLDEYISRMKEP